MANIETKRTPAITVEVDQHGLTLTFSHGKQLRLDVAQLSNEIQQTALVHGLKQKLVDAAAIPCNRTTGRAASISEKYDAVRKVYERILMDGLWNEVREGGGNAGGILLQALMRLHPNKTKEALKAWLDGKSDAEKTALRANPKIAAFIREIEAERASATDIDSDDLLSEIE